MAQGRSLADTMKEGSQRARANAATAIGRLASTAEELGLHEANSRLKETRAKLESDQFSLIVMGRFKNGKSTLLNALLGGTTHPIELGGQHGPMVVNDLPATATLTAVTFSDEPTVKAVMLDGSSESWTFARYLNESTLGIDPEENIKRFQQIRQFDMGFPAKLCAAGVTIFDSPGLDEEDVRTRVTRDASRVCDAAIIVYRTDALMGQAERMDAARVVADGTKVFTVVNLWNREVDDQLRGYVWNRSGYDDDGVVDKWVGQDLASRDIYFVDAHAAREARYRGEDPALGRSGLIEFERRLADFLLLERQHVHLQKFTSAATNEAGAMEQHIIERQQAALADQEELEKAYQSIIPRLDAIRERPSQLSRIFARYVAEARRDVSSSYAHTLARLRLELPGDLEAVPLTCLEGNFVGKLAKPFFAKQLQQEAQQAVNKLIRERLDKWADEEVPNVLSPIFDRLHDEIKEEIASISREFDAVHLELTGFALTGPSGRLVSNTERVLSAAAGLMFGDFIGVATGSVGGWRGAAGAIGGSLATGFVLGLIGITAAPVVIPVAAVAALIVGTHAGGLGLETRIKQKCAEEADNMIRSSTAESASKIELQLVERLHPIEEGVIKEATDVIAEEERNIREVVELNRRDRGEREAALAVLTKAAEQVQECKEELRQSSITASQTA
jgi:GTPase SAR1 family protein